MRTSLHSSPMPQGNCPIFQAIGPTLPLLSFNPSPWSHNFGISEFFLILIHIDNWTCMIGCHIYCYKTPCTAKKNSGIFFICQGFCMWLNRKNISSACQWNILNILFPSSGLEIYFKIWKIPGNQWAERKKFNKFPLDVSEFRFFSFFAVFRWSWSVYSHTQTYTQKWDIQIQYNNFY
jgi:hypothetical protein